MLVRVTINDVARAAGVSKGAASNALNDRPGVSESTRQRVKDAAARLGWAPNQMARALSGARSDSIGWAIVRSPKSSTIDPYFTQMFAGIELELEGTEMSLLTKLVRDRDAEAELYRRWAAERRVGGVIVNDIDADEGRFAELAALELPFAAFRSTVAREGAMPSELRISTLPTGALVPSVWFRETEAVSTLLDFAADRGHARVGWISGATEKAAVVLRERAVERWASDHRMRVTTVFTDYSPAAGAQAALGLVDAEDPPSFVVFDSDVMALGGLSALRAAGYGVPEDISIASFIDSELCEIALPRITALVHPVVDYGRALTRRLVDEIVSGRGTDDWLPVPKLVERDSVARRAAH